VYDSHQLKLKETTVESVNIELHACVHMTSEPLEILKKGLASLKRCISAKKDHLTTRLKNGQPISEEDETWSCNALIVAVEALRGSVEGAAVAV